MKNEEKEILNAYVNNVERQTANIEPVESGQKNFNVPEESVSQNNTTKRMTTAEAAHAQKWNGKDAPDNGLKYKDNIGWMRLDIESLPTAGLFYPQGSKILIRAARGGEIKHWSTMNDQDLDKMSEVDDILNYILEKCVSVEMPGIVGCSWKDLKDVDRFYILLAIREFTFIDGNNNLMVPVSEGKEIPVTKEMINFIDIPKELMKYYSETDRCFVFNMHGNTLRMYIPSLGSSQWLKSYVQAKNQMREGFDADFIYYAPMLINDFRKLTRNSYEELVGASAIWSAEEWSLIANVRDALMNSTEPKITYTNDDGEEVKIPLTFRGGIKSLFLVQNSIFNVR